MRTRVAGNEILDKAGDIQKPVQQIRVTVITHTFTHSRNLDGKSSERGITDE